MRAVDSYRVHRSSEKFKKDHFGWLHLANSLLHVHSLILNPTLSFYILFVLPELVTIKK